MDLFEKINKITETLDKSVFYEKNITKIIQTYIYIKYQTSIYIYMFFSTYLCGTCYIYF